MPWLPRPGQGRERRAGRGRPAAGSGGGAVTGTRQPGPGRRGGASSPPGSHFHPLNSSKQENPAGTVPPGGSFGYRRSRGWWEGVESRPPFFPEPVLPFWGWISQALAGSASSRAHLKRIGIRCGDSERGESGAGILFYSPPPLLLLLFPRWYIWASSAACVFWQPSPSRNRRQTVFGLFCLSDGLAVPPRSVRGLYRRGKAQPLAFFFSKKNFGGVCGEVGGLRLRRSRAAALGTGRVTAGGGFCGAIPKCRLR